LKHSGKLYKFTSKCNGPFFETQIQNAGRRARMVSAARTIRDSSLDEVHSYCLCCTAPSITKWLPIGGVWRDVTKTTLGI